MARTPVSVEDRDEQRDQMQSVDDDSVMQLDPATLDSNYRYRFAYNNPNRIARLRAKGYEYVTVDMDEKLKDVTVGVEDAAGRICVGDSVLMRCPKNRYDRRRRDVQKINSDRLNEGMGTKAVADIQAVANQTGLDVPIITK